jgi:hypothetical protein
VVLLAVWLEPMDNCTNERLCEAHALKLESVSRALSMAE